MHFVCNSTRKYYSHLTTFFKIFIVCDVITMPYKIRRNAPFLIPGQKGLSKVLYWHGIVALKHLGRFHRVFLLLLD